MVMTACGPAWTQDYNWRALQADVSGFPENLVLLEMCAGCGTAGVGLDLLLGHGKWALGELYDRDHKVRSVLETHVQDMGACHLGLLPQRQCGGGGPAVPGQA